MLFNTAPFSTIEPGESMMRIGLGCMAISHLVASEEIRPVARKAVHLTLDSPEAVNQRLAGLFDINFPPLAIVNLYRLLSHPPTQEQQDKLLLQTDLYTDTVVFNLNDRVPAEAVWDNLFANGNHCRYTTYLVMKQGGKSHFFKCGGPRVDDDVDAFFLEWGQVGNASLVDMRDQYEHARIKPEEELDEVGTRNMDFTNWMIANALIANLAFTAVSQQ